MVMVGVKNKLRLLVLCCLFLIAVLSMVQFYLIRNTYRLTKSEYYKEVQAAMNEVLATAAIRQMQDSAFSILKRQLMEEERASGHSSHGTRETFHSEYGNLLKRGNQLLLSEMEKRPSLRNVKFKSQYEEIVLDVDGRSDTIMYRAEPSIIILGSGTHSGKELLLDQWNQREGNTLTETSAFITVSVRGAQYIDISDWQWKVFQRMSVIYILAVALIAAFIALFHQMMRSVIKQKKIADMKTDFANNITHELKTPLSSLNIITKSLERDELRENAVLFSKMLDALKRQHTKVHKIIDHVLESSMQHQKEVTSRQVHLAEFLNDYLDHFQSETHLVIRDIANEDTIINTDPEKLESILDNLMENAIKYSKAVSHVEVKAYRSGKSYRIDIQDEGIGIEKEQQAQVFDKFYRVPQHNRHDVKGLGLGLYICRQTAALIGGSLTLSSKPQKGSTFTLSLPLDKGATAEAHRKNTIADEK